MFVPCLHRRGPAQQEDLGRRAARIQIARPVVLDLVIVERRHERRGGMRGPQIGIDLVERVAPPVIVEAVDLVAVMVADRSEEHTYELQSLMRITYAVFSLKKKK